MVLTKMTTKIERKYGKKILNDDVEKVKRKLALLVGYYR
jgi:dephospho-CoA kinase